MELMPCTQPKVQYRNSDSDSRNDTDLKRESSMKKYLVLKIT